MSLPSSISLAENYSHAAHEYEELEHLMCSSIKFARPGQILYHNTDFDMSKKFRFAVTKAVGNSTTREELFRGFN